jgi:inosine-uridine nucleoside N-ribohydrolase
MQAPEQGKPPVGIIYDSDLGNRIDDALALALLYGLDGKREARVVSVSVTKSNLKAAAFCEAIGRFYSGAVSGAFSAVGRTLPVGLNTDGKMAEDTPMLTGPLSKLNAEGAPLYPHGIEKLNDTAEPTALIRNAFTAQHDQNSIVVLAGPATNLVKVLDLPGVKDLITRKVRFLTLMGGAYPQGAPEFNIKTDIPAARKLFAEWPIPIIASGYELGEKLLFPASSIETDFSWSAAHPVVEAYRAYKTMPYDAPTWDMTVVLYAVRPDANYFKLSEPGTISVLDDGRTRFSPSPQGKHRYLILDPAQKENILKTYIEVASAKPVPRQPRRRQQQQEQQQQQQQQQQKAPAPVKTPEVKPPTP